MATNPIAMTTPNPGAIAPVAVDPNNPDYAGIMTPGFNPVYNPAADNVSQYYNPAGLNAYSQMAMSTGPSAMAQLANEQQTALAGQQIANAAAQAQSETAQGNDRLSQQGGLTSGANERNEEAGAKNALSMDQSINQGSANNQMQIGINDAQNRISQLGQLPGMEQAALQPHETDVQNLMSENNALNAYNANVANMQNQAVAATQQAQATAASAPSCWLITGLSRFIKLPKDEADLLTKFKWAVLHADKAGAEFYIRRCGPLVKKMDAGNFDWVSFEWYNTALMSLMRAGENQAAYLLFKAVLTDLLMAYWDDCPHLHFTRLKKERDIKLDVAQNIMKPMLNAGEDVLGEVCLKNVEADRFE